MDGSLRTTVLTGRHEDAGAKLVSFAGWLMPIRFAGTLAEHRAVRTAVGVFDVSHLGTVWVRGPGAGRVIAATFTNDPASLDDGTSQYTLCCDEDGGVIDDLIVYRLDAQQWLVVPNAANTDAVVSALQQVAGDDAHVADETAEHAVLAVQGPQAFATLDAVLATAGLRAPAAADLDHLRVVEVTASGAPAGSAAGAVSPGGVGSGASVDVTTGRGLLARTGYTGEQGCELVVPGAWASALWDALVAAGAVPCGLGARDTLRLEMGYPLHGNELSRETSPYEARLGWAVRLDREPFRGAAALHRLREGRPVRRLWGLLVEGRRPARAGMTVHDGDAVVGRTTSGTLSPTLERPIALAYLDDPLGPGDTVTVDVRGTPVTAEVVHPPFVDRDPSG